MVKTNYIYLAIGYDLSKPCNKLSLLCPLLRMLFYIGVRTGQLPDDSYRTSASLARLGKWKYLAKVPLAIYNLREIANEAEAAVLRYIKSEKLWCMLANKSIGNDYCNLGKKLGPFTEEHKANIASAKTGKKIHRHKQRHSPSAETRAKQSAIMKGRIYGPQTPSHTSNNKAARKLHQLAKIQGYCPIMLISPQNEHIIFYNSTDLYVFIERNMCFDKAIISKLISAKIKSSKGWKLKCNYNG